MFEHDELRAYEMEGPMFIRPPAPLKPETPVPNSPGLIVLLSRKEK